MSRKKTRSLYPLKNYISSLIENIDKTNVPSNIDLVLDGGAFNGGFMFGQLLYLKEIENTGFTKIGKISGCSVGSILGLLYLTDTLDKGAAFYEKTLLSFRKNYFLDIVPTLIKNFVNQNITDVSQLNDRLYITYYNLNIMKQHIVHKYNDKEELIDYLIKSSYVPFLTDGKIKYDRKYCDGITPYIFPNNENKILFIKLMSIKNIVSSIIIKNEKNIWSRSMVGLVDINKFFSNEGSEFCSYINNFSIGELVAIKTREMNILIVLSLVQFCNILGKQIKDNIYVSSFKTIFYELYKDILDYCIL